MMAAKSIVINEIILIAGQELANINFFVIGIPPEISGADLTEDYRDRKQECHSTLIRLQAKLQR